MESRQNPLAIPELVDHCISLLSGDGPWSRADLLSCCLVARSWVQPSQYYLFYSPEDLAIRGSTSISQLFDTLIENPHLIRYVRSLTIPSATIMGKMCRIPFAHLQRVVIRTDLEDLEQWEGEGVKPQLQQILSISSLRVLHLCGNVDLPFFHPFFKNLSPTIQHLSLSLRYPWNEEDFAVPQASVSSLSLKSLVLSLDSDEGTQSLDNALFYPFDILNLEALSVSHPFYIHWDSIPKHTKESLRVLNIYIKYSTPVDLSSFPNLTTLRLDNLTCPSCVSTILSSIPSPRTIRTIVLGVNCFFEDSDWAPLDSLLSSFECSSPPMIEYETPRQEHDELRSEFPILMSQNRFRVIYHSDHSDWWEEMVYKI
ncbi:hypothetical protein R3P38DRAFT_3078439 [Favolaschia claudopus]|uniref:F-box domain-containing protein n=1 Tax=Favolaschia claudopus TaxID=2862362 RepID=A0AAV9ZVF0_9AGAR